MACSNSSDAESEKKSTEKSQTVTDTDDKKQNAGEKRESGNGQSGDAGAKDTVVVYFSGTGNTKKLQKSFRKNYRQIFWKSYRQKHIQVKIWTTMMIPAVRTRR